MPPPSPSVSALSYLPFLLPLILLSTQFRGAMAAFDALPFLQIDYHFYLRLAQCQAKCAEKFPDGRPSMDTLPGNSLLELCHQGCLDSDSPSQQRAENNPQSLAFAQGQLLFHQSLAHGHGHHHHPTAVLRIRPLCAQRMSQGADTPSEKLEAILALDMAEAGKRGGSHKFVVQWRRKAMEPDEEPKKEEGKEEGRPRWITGSIEPQSTFRVTSLPAGLLHQFQVQPVSALGPVGPPATSDWIDFGQLAGGSGLAGASLQFFSQYNSEHGVAAWVRWRGEQTATGESVPPPPPPKPILNARVRRSLRHFSPPPSTPLAIFYESNEEEEPKRETGSQTIISGAAPSHHPVAASHPPVVFPACRLQIEWANKSTRAVEQMELNASDGFLLPHLAFNSEYSVRLLATSVQSSGQHALLEGTFLSMHCAQVFGPGSLECEPEPIRGLSVLAFPDNGTALISWERPEASANILLYELAIEPIRGHNANANGRVEEGEECQVSPSARVIAAQSNAALVSLPTVAVCNFEIRLTLYDLLGRDASAPGVRFQFVPAGLSAPSPPHPFYPSAIQLLAHLDASLLALLFVLIVVPVAALASLICTFWRHTARRERKAAAKKRRGPAVKNEKAGRKCWGKKRAEEEEKKEGGGSGNGKMPKAEGEKGSGTQSPPCNSPQWSATGTEITTAKMTMTTDEDEEDVVDEEAKKMNGGGAGRGAGRRGGGGRRSCLRKGAVAIALGEV